MAYNQKSKFTSSGLINRFDNKTKLNNSSKTPFFQQKKYQQPEDIENLVVTKTDDVTGGATEAYVPGAAGTVSRERGTIEETFENITPEELKKVEDEGFTADLKGYAQYVEGYNTGTLPSQRTDYIGDLKVTDPVDGKPSYNTRLSINVLKDLPVFQDIPDFADELPYGKQKEMLFEVLKTRDEFDDDTKKKIFENFKKAWEKQNNRKLTYNKPESGKPSTPGSTEYLGLTELEN